MDLAALVIGILLLTLGRRLFWLFVGAAGFLVGVELARHSLVTHYGWEPLVVGLAAGVLGALLAIFLQRIAVAVAGFVGGGYALMGLLGLSHWRHPADLPAWMAFIVGGVIGLVLVTMLFDWALIILSSLVGSSMIVHAHAVQIAPHSMPLVFLVLAVVGIIVQAHLLHTRWHPRRARA